MKYIDHMDDLFSELHDLTPLQRRTLTERYRFLMTEYRRRCCLYSTLFYSFRITMTVGSLAVPALLSIQNTPGSTGVMYWFTWGLSLAVTTANGIMTLFKIDKRFFMLHATAERLRSETWQYLQLSGRYSGHHVHGNIKPSHANQYVFYCSQLEKINMKRVDDEFVKTGEETQPAAAIAKASSEALVPSPPEMQTPDSGKSSITVEDNGNDNDNDRRYAAPGNTITLQMSES